MNTLPSAASAFTDNTAYIIRRTAETSAATLPNGTNSTVKNILFIGMPNAADELYELIPDEAKIAWGADSAQYANIIFEAASGSFQLPSINHFLLHRIYLFRDSINADNYIFKMSNSSQSIGCYSFEHCKFGSRGVNLDRSDYVQTLTASRCKSYVYVYYARMLNIRDCIMNHAVTGNTQNPHGIYCYFADILNIENVKVYSAVWTDMYNYYPLYLSGTSSKGIECRIRNIELIIRFNGAATKVPSLFYLQGYTFCEISGITVKMGTPLSETRPTSFQVDSSMMHLASVFELSLTDVNVNLPDCWYCNSPILEIDRCCLGNYIPGVVKKISNVSITLATENGIGSPITYEYASNPNDAYVAAMISFSSSECTLYAKVPEISDMTIIHPRGKAIYLEEARLTNATFEGTVVLSRVVADIHSVSTWFPGKVLFVEDGTHARVRMLTVNLENSEYPYNEDSAVFSRLSDYGNVFVDESNAALAPMASESSKASHVYQGIGCNNEGASGHFAYRCANGLCDTWSVHRVGGGASALKFYNNTCSSPDTMVIGRRPFNGMQITPTTTGRHILRAHIAYKGYAKEAEMFRHFFISVSINGTTYYSTIHGRWLNDSASVWQNDSELTQKVLELPFDINEVSPVDVRV
jgi:hypothetical protein